MKTINTGVVQKGLNGAFFARLAATAALYRDLCMEIPSTSDKETYKWLGNLPLPSEWKGRRQFKPLRDYGQTLTNVPFESSLAIDRYEYDDDQTGQLNLRAGELATAFARHPDKLLIDLMIAAEATACYDGQYFFDTDHSEGDSGSQSNDLTYDVAVTTAPTVAEFKAALWQAVLALAGFKDDQGEPWNHFTELEMLKGIVAVVPLPFLPVAAELFGANAAPIIAQTTNILAGRGRVITSARLTWTTKFAVLKVDDPIKPFIFQNRQPLQSQMKDDPEDKEIKFLLDARYAMGYGLWQKAVLTTLV